METASITEARANIFKIAEQAIESHEPITLTYKKGDVVMMSLEDYESLQETLYILQTMPGIVERAKETKKAKAKDLYTRDQYNGGSI